MTGNRDVRNTRVDGQIRTAEVIGALSLAADLAMGLPAEHALRSCCLGMRMAEELGLSARERVNLYYTTLLVDAGCTAWASQLADALQNDETTARQDWLFRTDVKSRRARLRWLMRYCAPGEPVPERVRLLLQFLVHRRSFDRDAFQNTGEVAQRLAERLGMPPEVRIGLGGLNAHFEIEGPPPVARRDIPILSRLAYMALVLEVVHRAGGRAAAERIARDRAGTFFPATLVEAFLSVSKSSDFWAPLEQANVWRSVQDLEPDSQYRYFPANRLLRVAESFADFVDLKAPHSAGHSRRVADLALRMARRMMFSSEQLFVIGIAAMAHDLGLVAAPAFTLNKPWESLTPSEWETLRLHPYYGERILARVPALRDAAALVAAHHEREDGQGYHRALAGAQVPAGASVIAVADRFDELTHDAPGRGAVSAESALEMMRGEQDGALWCAGVDTLAAETGAPATPRAQGHPGTRWPAGLTNREVEVLRIMCRCLTTRQMAEALHISESTVRHHLEHIYAKVGVTTRTAAALFAMERGLLS